MADAIRTGVAAGTGQAQHCRSRRRIGALLALGSLYAYIALPTGRLPALCAMVLAMILVMLDSMTAVDDQGILSLLAILWNYRNTDFVTFRADHARHYQIAEQTNNYVPAVCHYYQLMSDLITLASGPLWHFVPMTKGLTRKECHEAFNHLVVTKLEALPTDRILEYGCGYGEIGRQVAKLSGAKVVGLTIADEEIVGANARIKKAGLEEQCQMVQGNYHKMLFDANSFTKVFGTYTLKYSHSLEEAYTELARVLQPGGLLLSYEIRVTEKYDPNNKVHRDHVYNISYSTGMPPLWFGKDFRKAAEKAGLILQEETDLCHGDADAWYACFTRTGVYPLLRSSLIKKAVRCAEALRILPREFSRFYEDHIVHPAADFVEAGRLGIVDGAVLMLWRKP